ncbi:hypothetical protein FS842_006115 [Serendipita sp. 407]|nr:hypothetical protein FS842_006115 [Serendipita sp. 407]
MNSRLGPLANFLTYTRFSATLRAGKQTYHSLLIFRLSGGILANSSQSTLGFKQTQAIRDGKEMQIYAMEAQCPHLGADLSHAEIEECDDEVVAVCPWHRYDFNLKTGISETGLRACVYEVQLRTEEDSTEEDVWIETPPSAESWEVLGTSYGSLPIHSSLWESALKTSDSFLARLAIIHLVHEARGLDVNPVTISKFEKAGDTESVASLQIIHLDEITHVTSGHRWFTWKCGEEGIDPVQTFRSLVRERFQGQLRGPFNIDDRKKAGMGKEFYEDLVGGSEVEEATGAAAPGLTIAYES